MAEKKTSFIDTISSAVSSVGGGVDRTTADITEAKDAAIAYGSTTLVLQLIATGAACVIAYVAWQNYNKGRKTLLNGKGKSK